MDGKEGNGKKSPEEEAIARAGSTSTRGRKLYQRPAFRHERVFETRALSCGKVGTLSLQCKSNNQNS